MKDFKDVGAQKTLPLTNTPKFFEPIIKLLRDKELKVDTCKEFENTDKFWNYTPQETKTYFRKKQEIKNEIDTIKVFFYEYDLNERKRKKQANFDLQKQLELWVMEHKNNLLEERIRSLEIQLIGSNTLLEFEIFSRELNKKLSENG